jgi:hypothetical protein
MISVWSGIVRAGAALFQWMQFGLMVVGLFSGILSLCMQASTLLILKGINVPTSIIFQAFVLVSIGVLSLGWALQATGLISAINSRSNRMMNPEFDRQCKNIDRIMEHLGIEDTP